MVRVCEYCKKPVNCTHAVCHPQVNPGKISCTRFRLCQKGSLFQNPHSRISKNGRDISTHRFFCSSITSGLKGLLPVALKLPVDKHIIRGS